MTVEGELAWLSVLTLDVTSACPLQCAHCCVESGPSRRDTMEIAEAVAWVTEAVEINPNLLLRFLGGEPFSRFGVMLAAAGEAHRSGCSCVVTTGAGWVRDRAHAEDRMTQLQQVGLRAVYVSYDVFHDPWVKTKQVVDCIAAARELGLEVVVAEVTTTSGPSARELLGDALEGIDGVVFDGQPLGPTGRGRDLPASMVPVMDWGKVNLRCPVRTELMIRWDGAAYLCPTQIYSSTADIHSPAGQRERENPLYLGDARVMTLRELRAAAGKKGWFGVVTTGGFDELERIVQRHHPGFRLPRVHAGVCNLCTLTVGSPRFGPLVANAFDREAHLGQEDLPQPAEGGGI